MVKIYDADSHISLDETCKCCGQSFLAEISNPQKWLEIKVIDMMDMLTATEPRDRIERAKALGATLNELGKEAIWVRQGEDNELYVSGWIGAYDEDGVELFSYECPERPLLEIKDHGN